MLISTFQKSITTFSPIDTLSTKTTLTIHQHVLKSICTETILPVFTAVKTECYLLLQLPYHVIPRVKYDHWHYKTFSRHFTRLITNRAKNDNRIYTFIMDMLMLKSQSDI